MHVCITLRFAGTRYHGFQVQKMRFRCARCCRTRWKACTACGRR